MSTSYNNAVSGLFDLLKNNKPQASAFASAMMILITSGMFINAAYLEGDNLLCVSWFAAALAATLMGIAANYFLLKKVIMFIAVVLVILSSLLGLIFKSNDNTAAYFSFALNGLATGLIYVPTLSLVGELSNHKLRGLHAAFTEAISFGTGFMLSFSLATQQKLLPLDEDPAAMSISQQRGIICLIFGIMSLLLNFFLTKESPIKVLSAQGEEQAVQILTQLQRKQEPNTETYDWLNELKHYVETQQVHSLKDSAILGRPALLKVVFYRCLVALGNCWIMHKLLFEFMFMGDQNLILACSGVFRLLGTYLGACLLDYLGRLRIMQSSALVNSAFVLCVAMLPQKPENIQAASWCLIIFQIFAGLFMAPSAVYMTEAFPLRVKPFFIALSYCVELLLQLILCFCSDADSTVFLYILAVLYLIFFACAMFCYPETRLLSLKEAELQFRIWILRPFI